LANRLKHTPRASFPLPKGSRSALPALETLTKFKAPSRGGDSEEEGDNEFLATAARWSAVVPVVEALPIAMAVKLRAQAAGLQQAFGREKIETWLETWMKAVLSRVSLLTKPDGSQPDIDSKITFEKL